MIARLLGLPRWLRLALAIVGIGTLIGGAWALWLHGHDTAVIATHEAAVTAKVTTITSAASTSASRAADAARTEVEQTNAHARAAADASDDPLRAGLGQLRADHGADRPAAR